jgi:predicted nucleic acid-binding protein
VRFWDTSAIVPLLVGEPSTPDVMAVADEDREMVVWWATQVECMSAIARMDREARLAPSGTTNAIERLDELIRAWQEVQPVDRIRRTANRLLRTHGLRAADAFQLSAAISASEEQPSSLRFVTLDARLAQAAEREGFKVVVPSTGEAWRPGQ